MKVTVKSYKMVILPYGSVPHRVIFRYNNNWWKRQVGSLYLAEKLFVGNITLVPTYTRCLIDDDELVALPRYRIEKTIAFAAIVDEFDVSPTIGETRKPIPSLPPWSKCEANKYIVACHEGLDVCPK